MIPIQPLTGTNAKNYWQLLKTNEFKIGLKYLPKMLYTAMVATCVITPLHVLETFSKKQALSNVEVKKPPIFIIGHWRSGTTFLHYLMAKDSQFAYLNNAQSFCPSYLFYHLPQLAQKFIHWHLPKKRPMDRMEMNLYSPQEEEFALSNLSTQSCYHWWNFPNKMVEYFEKYALLQNLNIEEYQLFKKQYLQFIKKLTLLNNGQRLLLKNPTNTGRIPMLLELFPDAQFIYLHRNPNDVYWSTVKLHTKLLECFSFQDFNSKKIEQNTLQFYRQLLQKYEKDKIAIPKANLIEIDFVELTKQPLATIKKIYSHLQLFNFDNAIDNFNAFIESQQNYIPDTYNLTLTSLTNQLTC